VKELEVIVYCCYVYFVVISGHAYKQLSCRTPLPRGISVQ